MDLYLLDTLAFNKIHSQLCTCLQMLWYIAYLSSTVMQCVFGDHSAPLLFEERGRLKCCSMGSFDELEVFAALKLAFRDQGIYLPDTFPFIEELTSASFKQIPAHFRHFVCALRTHYVLQIVKFRLFATRQIPLHRYRSRHRLWQTVANTLEGI
ncbi:uncharacterized protein LACBIDRAFT_330995 [Laccaria bicolor S238N-H82]|uniref:Predicted protein n=1 Tax=Laccaria bicolor (strain S238N-H82 / ATCC MYA-4686) TaxID=486041 RepID=B0DMX4_LACBS|nr:uncharacterized protein LACBIDRAFT_330995 [Laccaria bicolor S238N-H82]EDR04125.1 predicted protein [Laccaria bicolor S238N-H82]|eukprot:XP_001885380.1 predicted protein [Laccaria bicolor S238N-H82]